MSIPSIRPFADADWPELWAVLQPTFAAGDTYTYPVDISEAAARAVWVTQPAATFVAVDEKGTLLGTYFIKPNQGGGGAHVCNCGYVVAEAARGHGVAEQMCRHSQDQARSRGFCAMQFNFVVSTNAAAMRLWQRLGFEVVGTLPGAFAHPRLGFVDAHVLFKTLAPQARS